MEGFVPKKYLVNSDAMMWFDDGNLMMNAYRYWGRSSVVNIPKVLGTTGGDKPELGMAWKCGPWVPANGLSFTYV